MVTVSIPLLNTETGCLCGSTDDYDSCCGRFHDGSSLPLSAEALMRSRYSAYALRNAVYLLQTWDPAKRPKTLDFADETVIWQGLQIVNTKKGGRKDKHGLVEFQAFYEQDGVGQVMTEISRFTKIKGRWYYLDGVVKASNV